MYYQIVVSKDGHHFFTTSDHSAVTADKAYELFHAIKWRFTEDMGYEVKMYHWKIEGREITP